ncbi:hypothetical protein B0H10DRAFT_2354624 [Mycena sp. CBHHK59/15]|nr:hypothetical protein B0H10DRAFT_2354624 [Mycena sp. CBHHK59/15]
MILDLIELAEGLEIPSSWADSKKWMNLKCSTADLIAVSMCLPSSASRFNIFSLLRHPSSLPLKCISPLRLGQLGRGTPLVASAQVIELSGHGQGTMDTNAKFYMRGLKDCIIGTLNWRYEMELYFSVKGNKVQQFRWVFLRVLGD